MFSRAFAVFCNLVDINYVAPVSVFPARLCYSFMTVILKVCRHLVCVKSPEVELLFKEWTTHIGRIVQLAGPVVVEYLCEDARMSVEEVLVEYRVVVGKRLGETRQPRRRDLLQSGLVCLVTNATHVDDDAVVSVRHGRHAPGLSSARTQPGNWNVLQRRGRQFKGTKTTLKLVDLIIQTDDAGCIVSLHNIRS